MIEIVAVVGIVLLGIVYVVVSAALIAGFILLALAMMAGGKNETSDD